MDVKEDLLNSLKEQREKIFAIESRVQSEMTRNLTEERAARESTITRLRDCEELQRQMERKVWNKVLFDFVFVLHVGQCMGR